MAEPLKPVTDAINAIAAKVDLPLDLAADLMKAIDGWGAYCAAKAAEAERERIAALAEECGVEYECVDAYQGEFWRPFAALIREQPTSIANLPNRKDAP